MLAELNAQLVTAKAQLTEQNRIAARLADLKQSLADIQREVEQSRALLDESEHDLKTLQGLSLKHLFHQLLGNESAQVDERQKEVLQASLRLTSAESVAKALARDVLSLEKRLAALSDAQSVYEAAFAAKEQFLANHDAGLRAKLQQLADEEADAKSQLTEIEEAARAAEQARQSLEACMGSLDSASNWGVADMMGGGMLTTMIKRDKMDMASGYASRQRQTCCG